MSTIAMDARKRIGINAHLLSGQEGYRRAGIHHYISQLLQNLPQEGSSFDFTLFANNVKDLGAQSSFSIATTRWPTQRPLVRIMWEQILWPLAAARLKIDLLHSMAFVTPVVSRRPAVVTVYDLSFVHYPERFPALKRAYLTSQTRRSCQQANRVVTISESGRQDVHRIYGISLDRIDIVYPGVDSAFYPRPDHEVEAFRSREELPGQFILHVGTLQPRKNIPLLIDAFAELRRPDLGLVLVGGKGWSYQKIFARVKELGLEHQVRFTGYVPDADLSLWYNAADALIFPSVYEGFGLPVLQAMACGTPVIAAQTSAVPEVARGAALFFDPLDIATLVEHMVTVLDEPQIAATMQEQGVAQAQNFSWQRAGHQLLSVYQRVLSEK